MKKLASFLFFLIITSCNSDKSFFDFDEAILYSFDSKDEKHFKSLDSLNSEEKQYAYLVYDYYKYPSSVNDKKMIPRIERFYSVKKEIPKQKFAKLDSIFSVRTPVSDEVSGCDPIFRDILIFKQKGKVVGVAKLCFQCGLYYIIGSKHETENFGYSGEIRELKKLLKE